MTTPRDEAAPVRNASPVTVGDIAAVRNAEGVTLYLRIVSVGRLPDGRWVLETEQDGQP